MEKCSYYIRFLKYYIYQSDIEKKGQSFIGKTRHDLSQLYPDIIIYDSDKDAEIYYEFPSFIITTANGLITTIRFSPKGN